MNGVHVPAERKFNFRLRGVDLNSGFLGPGCGRENHRGQRGEGAEEEWNGESAKENGFCES